MRNYVFLDPPTLAAMTVTSEDEVAMLLLRGFSRRVYPCRMFHHAPRGSTCNVCGGTIDSPAEYGVLFANNHWDK